MPGHKQGVFALRRPYMLILMTVIIGIMAGLMRTFELRLAWEPALGLMKSYHPSSISLLVFSVAFTVLALIVSRSAPPFKGKRVAAPRQIPIYLTVDTLAALALIFSGVMDIYSNREDVQALITGEGVPAMGTASMLIFAVLSLFAGISVILIARAASKGVLGRAYGFYMTVPVFWACYWLILDFSKHAVNPVPLSYLYEMLGIIFTLLSLYAAAGFFFNLPRMRQTLVYSILGGFFSLITVLGLVMYRVLWGIWPVDNINWSDFARFVFSMLHLMCTVYIVRGQKFDVYRTHHKENENKSAPAEANS